MGVKLSSNRAWWWGAALWLCACTDNAAPPAPYEELDARLPPPRDTGVEVDAEVVGPGPVLELLSPLAAEDPSSENVVVGSSLPVRCQARKNPTGELVDPATVKVAVYAGEEVQPRVTQVATSTSEVDVFEADVSLGELPHGPIRIECSAADVSTTKESSALSIETLYDRGPIITFLNPMANGFVAAGVGEGEDVVVRFKVAPQPLSEDDEGASIDDIQVTVSGKPISSLVESATEEHVYSFGLDFSDTARFTVVPDTLTIRAEARNARNPAAQVASSLTVGVDSEGPKIVVRSPVGVGGAEPIVSGKVDILLEVTDALAGVDASSLEMRISVIGLGTKTYPTESRGNGEYTTTFEVGEFPDSASLTLNFVARDRAGIEATASQGVRIDDQPPWVSLTPHTVRDRTTRTRPSPDECSGPFDPLGDAPNDGDIVKKAVRLRALAWDRPRTVSGLTVFHYAMVDQANVQIVVQHDTSVPLLINSRGIAGGPCDAVNVSPAGGGRVPVIIGLVPMVPSGTAPLGAASDLTAEPNVGIDSPYTCTGTGGSPPAPLCGDLSMTRIIKHAVPGSFPVVYGINVIPSTVCTGDYYSNPSTGPACLVAQARDNAGNKAFSAPIRLCVEYSDLEDQIVTCPAGALDGITCTDGCVLPTQFGPNAPDRMPPVVNVN